LDHIFISLHINKHVSTSIEVEYIMLLLQQNNSFGYKLYWLNLDIIQLLNTFYYDIQSCIGLTKSPKFHDRSKHIDIKYHFLRKKVDS
jgi:hypothetical protein